MNFFGNKLGANQKVFSGFDLVSAFLIMDTQNVMAPGSLVFFESLRRIPSLQRHCQRLNLPEFFKSNFL